MSEIDNSNLSYTSRDYESILRELLNTIPLLTKTWTAREESDPGIVLVKLMAMVGDMLSYNIDKQALEMFPESVTQRKNAYQIYNLQGYKMHWYKSARCSAQLLVNGSAIENDYTIPRYSRFATRSDLKEENNIYYTNLKEIEIHPGDASSKVNKTVELIQGIAKTPSVSANTTIVDGRWWDNFGYNLSSNDFDENNRYYLNDSNVDEDTIVLCDSTGEWVLVEDVDLVLDINKSMYGNRYFDFRIDEYDRPYIRLCSSWKKDNENEERFKLFYILSAGSAGQISSRTLIPIDNRVAISEVINDASTEGLDPETPYEAWINSRKYVNTNDTLITCEDFTKAIKRVRGVANALALDWMLDVQDPVATNMKNYEIRIYVLPDEEYLNKLSDDRDDAIRQVYESIENYLKSLKILHLLTRTYWDGNFDPSSASIETTNVIQHFQWSVEGILYYRTPLNKADSDEIINLVNNTLRLKFSNKKVNFNQAIRYIDVVNEILSCDSRILYVDLKPIAYQKVTTEGGQTVLVPATEKDVTGKNVIEIPPNPFDTGDPSYNPCEYEIDLTDEYEDTLPIKPSTVSIKVEGGNFTIYDNGNGKLVSGIVEGENAILASGEGTIDYGRFDTIDGVTNPNKGKLNFELRYATAAPLILSYKKNQIAIAEYVNLDPDKFYASADSLKKKV